MASISSELILFCIQYISITKAANIKTFLSLLVSSVYLTPTPLLVQGEGSCSENWFLLKWTSSCRERGAWRSPPECNSFGQAISLRSVLDCFVPRNDGPKLLCLIEASPDRPFPKLFRAFQKFNGILVQSNLSYSCRQTQLCLVFNTIHL